MRLQKWGGLFTNASPYAVPPGGAVTQVNLTCSTMGQLTVRNGMRIVAFNDGAPSNCLDVAGYAHNGQNKVLLFDASGMLSVLSVPAYGTARSAPYLPPLPFTGDQINVGYDYRWNDEVGEPVPEGQMFNGIFGGYVSTATWPGCVDAMNYCGGGRVDDWHGGDPHTTTFPAVLQYGRDICPCCCWENPIGSDFDGVIGGYVGTNSWPGTVNAMEYCGGTRVDDWEGGPPITNYPAALQYNRDICP